MDGRAGTPQLMKRLEYIKDYQTHCMGGADRMVMNAAVKLRRALLTLLSSADGIRHQAYNDINISIHYWIQVLLSKHF